eukprot:CAMPEP_0185744654 /NCGR_PEP_ID=MMETSP1174-20130828/2796_1 /TAXON_ID=35687 /ORGANISM="Dictyocha speculum, Strain CCMP1381" /LENGTH=843 /DNA_ID=CAMNT_0028418167 /DNA_START=430 /DNA_END=2961 /DNA_ORIENTATION=-
MNPIEPADMKVAGTDMGSVSTVAHRPTAKPCATRAVDQITELKHTNNRIFKNIDGPKAELGSDFAATDRVAKRVGGIPTRMARQTPFAMVDATKSVEGTNALGKVWQTICHTEQICQEGLTELISHISGGKRDVLVLLLAAALTAPVMKAFDLSPIIGFMITGCLLGPSALDVIHDMHNIEMLAELGIVFFLFEMGLELSLDRLKAMKKDVFGLGLLQMVISSVVLTNLAKLVLPGVSSATALVVGGGLALSSSAFVLQLLRDNDDLGTRQGRAAFGILLFQDLAIVPMLVGLPLLAGSGTSVSVALFTAVVKTIIAMSAISFTGAFLLNPLFYAVSKSKSHTSFFALVIVTVLSMSFVTEGLGLSNTLGAFLAGVLLSETRYKYQVEADIAPFRGLLLGLFFTTVGFSIDLQLLSAQFPLFVGAIGGLLAAKACVIIALCRLFKIRLSQSIQAGLFLSQGGEFAFVIFGLAKKIGLMSEPTSKFLLTATAISMGTTPVLSSYANKIAARMEGKGKGKAGALLTEKDSDAEEKISEGDFVIVIGHGRVGKVVCDVLDTKLVNYIALDYDLKLCTLDSKRTVYFADATQAMVLESFGVEKCKVVITTVCDEKVCDEIVTTMRRNFADVPIIARASSEKHMAGLQKNANVQAMLPYVPEDDSYVQNLPFGGEVLKAMGYDTFEVDSIVQDIRHRVMEPNNFITDSAIKTIGGDLLQPPVFFIPKVENNEEIMDFTLPESMDDLPWRTRCQAIFAHLDPDHTGTVDFNQLVSCIIRESEKVRSTPEEYLFKAVAPPSNGQISLEEFFKFVDEAGASLPSITPTLSLKGKKMKSSDASTFRKEAKQL